MNFTFKVGKIHASIPGTDSLIHLTDVEITTEIEPEYFKQIMENFKTLISEVKSLYEFTRDELPCGNIKDIKNSINQLNGGTSCGEKYSEDVS